MGSRISSQQLVTDRLGIKPTPIRVLGSQLNRGVALRQQLIQAVTRPRSGFNKQTTMVDRQAHGASSRQVQVIEEGGRNRQHDRSAHFAQFGGVHRDAFRTTNYTNVPLQGQGEPWSALFLKSHPTSLSDRSTPC